MKINNKDPYLISFKFFPIHVKIRDIILNQIKGEKKMKHKDFEFNGPSRSNQRAKRRKTNLILNSLIVIVLLLIIIVSFSIFFSNGDEATDQVSDQNIETKAKDKDDETNTNAEEDEANNPDDEAVETSSPVEAESDTNSDTGESVTEESIPEDETATEPESEDLVTEGSSDPNVKLTITNPDWQPVGTVQSGEHATVYDESSTDWQEMLKAVSYGTGIDQSNMTVWFLGRNKQGTENQSVATVSTRDNSQTYRVFIEWVDNQGWKPIKIEELYER
jgi:cytoskeletal protein RodZ